MTDLVINFDDAREKADIFGRLGRLHGMNRLTICRARPRRSDKQNRYYWPCFVQPLADFLKQQDHGITDDYAHEILKHKFLRREVKDVNTGEVMTFTASTTELTTAEFNEYLENCAQWLAEMFGIVVPEPSVWRQED